MSHSENLVQFQHHVLRRKFTRLLEGLQRNLHISNEELGDLLEVSPSRLSERFFEPDIEQLSRLADRFHFSLERFFTDDIDLEVLRQHHSGNELVLSEKYIPGGFSKRNIIINTLDFVEKTKGRRLKYLLMDHLYLTDAIYLDPNGPVNVLLYEDAAQFLLKHGMTRADLVHMGTHSSVTNRGTALAATLGAQRSTREMYEYYLTDLVTSIERNNFYRVRELSGTLCVVDSLENPELLDILKVKHAGGIGRCLYRTGTLGTATTYRGLPAARVTEVSCVHRGDAYCRFHIDFAQAAGLEASR